jgi:putative addiction module component (TIGR02574 family)
MDSLWCWLLAYFRLPSVLFSGATFCVMNAKLFSMKATLQPIEHLGKFERLQLVEDLWDEFAAETGPETRNEVLDELERRAAWRDAHPSQGKSLAQIAQSLGVRL